MVSPTAPFSAEDTTTRPVAMPMRTCKTADLGHVELGQGLDDLQPGMNRALGFALVRERIAEEGHDAIAQSLDRRNPRSG